MYFLSFAITAILFAYGSSYPHGAPEETCRIFTTNHTGQSPQTIPPQYEFRASPSAVSPGGTVTVTVRGIGAEKLKGFFVQGQDEAQGTPVGKFRTTAGSQTRDCSGPGSANAVTHIDASDKSQVTLKWQAPTSYVGSVVFRAVFVKTYEIFWDNIYSNTVIVG